MTNEREAQFQAWWRASKYCQVAYGAHEQVARDAWQAALTTKHSENASPRERREGDALADTQRAIIEAAELRGYERAKAEQQEAPVAVAYTSKTSLDSIDDPDGGMLIASKGRSEYRCIPLYTTPPAPVDVRLREALIVAEAALADIGDAILADPDDDLAWCERRAAKALPDVRQALALLDGQKAGVDWIERAAWCAESILRTALDQIPAEQGGSGSRHLAWMAMKLAAKDVGSETKCCRWLGYLQGQLVMLRLSTLDAEKLRNLESKTALGGGGRG